jgi:predicted transcriptional regulator
MRDEVPNQSNPGREPGKSHLDEAFRKASRQVEQTGQRIHQAIQDKHLDRELEQMITYLNDEVVPAVRSRSSQALRIAAKKLAKLAEHLEQGRD